MEKTKIVFSDFDGTLTLHEELRVSFFEIISLLKSQNLPLVIVTGRSKSWAHFLLSHFHYLTHVISEGGGNLSKVDVVDGRRHLKDELLIDQSEVDYLEKISRELVTRFNVSLSADSFGRETDRAIELYDLEDPKKMNEVQTFLKEKDINFSTSNVHLNFWKGEISKIKAIETYLKKYTEFSLKDSLFFGDSLNDQTVFQGMDHTVGVSNISQVLDRMDHKPKIILEGDENAGPAGVLNYLLK
ncbi:MAG: HAD-IIB family hydrolase [Halobacteriovoraceae bacterium]|nr:HAD-IIB family hydrolase [Halobacteriovoraceae bacterium]